MRAAAAIYVLSAMAVLGLVVYLAFAVGIGLGSFALTLTAVALLVLARGLIGGKSRANKCAIATSSFVTVGLFLLPLYCYAQGGWVEVSFIWPLLAPFVAFAIAHSVALAFLFGAKPNAA
jgi:hypothetical protein